uniref:Uncharacterized protein n=1 Tax=Romanomermis culicivorax TaxID=13658 RepID=A0A915KM31_ROMCU
MTEIRRNLFKSSLSRNLLKLKDEVDKKSSLSRFVVQKKMDKANPRSGEIDVATVQMIAVDAQPFGVVENPGFMIKTVALDLENNVLENYARMLILQTSTRNDAQLEGFGYFLIKNKRLPKSSTKLFSDEFYSFLPKTGLYIYI